MGTVLFFWPSSFPSLCQMHGHREEQWLCGMELRVSPILVSVVGLEPSVSTSQGHLAGGKAGVSLTPLLPFSQLLAGVKT